MKKISLKECFTRFIAWFKLHNRKVAAGLAMVVFSILMVICVVVMVESGETKTHINIETNLTREISDANLPKYGFCEQLEKIDELKEECPHRFNCINIPKDLQYFLWVLQNQIEKKCESIVELKIRSSEFENPLQEYWMYNLKPSIMNLVIENCHLLNIELAAFKGHPFSKMTSLELLDLYQLSQLNRGSFYYLNNIQNFTIGYTNFHYGLNFEPEVFNGMDSIQILRISNCIKDAQVLLDILAYKEALTKLREIDLSHNRLETLYDYTFKNGVNLKIINLENNLLSSIEPFAFWQLPLELLRIDKNNLKYISVEIFNYVHPTLAQIYASENPWECNCELQWLKEYSTATVILNTDTPLVCKDNIPFDDIESFCTTITTPSMPRTIVCPEQFQFPIRVPLADKSTQLVNTTLRIISEQDVNIEIFDIEEEEGIIEVVLTGNCSAYYLLWFPSGATQDYGCYSALQNSVYLTDMIRGADYTLCLIAREYEFASPFECLGFQVLPSWSEQIWIQNKYRSLTIGIAFLIILIIAIITSIATFYFIRQHPSMLKGNKRVIIVESKQADAIIMPKEYKGDAKEYSYTQPSLISYGQGYLKAISPQNNTYTYFEPPTLSICDLGDGHVAFKEDIISRDSIVLAYDTPPYVKKRSSQTGSVIFPPPLPPPNPNMRMSVTFNEIDGLPNHYSTA